MPIYLDLVKRLTTEMHAELRDGILDRLEFLKHLEADDDWSFVIKTQALIEAVLTEAILAHVGDDRIKPVVERLPLADDEAGKIALAKNLGIIDQAQRRFVRLMARLRNQLAHSIDHIDFSLTNHVSSLDGDGQKNWQQALIWFPTKNSRATYCELALKNPRAALWMAVFMFVTLTHLSAVEAHTPRRIDVAAIQTAEQIFKSLTREGDA